MGRKLYVGNLSYQTREDELRLAFAQCGKVVEAKVVTDKETGRSRGFGFVTMSTDAEAASAITRWSGSELDRRPLIVNEAVDKPRGQGTAPRQGGYSGASYVADPPPPDRGGRRGDRARGRSRDRGRDYG